MATLVLAAGGAAAGGAIGGTVLGVSAATIGGFVGATVGGAIDRSLFAPSATMQGPRLDDLRIQTSSYGSLIAQLHGPENRVSGNVIWTSGLKEEEVRETQSGGKGGGGSTTTVTYLYSMSVAVGIGEGPIGAVGRIWADGKLLADFREDIDTMAAAGFAWPYVSGSDARFRQITIYNGNETQQPNSLIEAAEGVGQVPAHRGLAYAVIEELQLADFGNRLPNLTFEVVAERSVTVGQVISRLATRSGLAEHNAKAVTANLRGLAIRNMTTARSVIEPLARVYRFDASEGFGEIRFIPLDRLPIAKVPRGRLAAHEGGGDKPPDRSITMANAFELPRAVELTYADPARDYQSNTQRSRRIAAAGTAVTTVETPVVLDAGQAKEAVEAIHRRAWHGRQRFEIALPGLYAELTAGDGIVVEDETGREFTLRAARVTNSRALVLQVEGVSGVLDAGLARSGAAPAVDETVIPGPAQVFAEFMDLPPLRDVDDTSGVYLAAGSQASAWRGVVAYISTDGGTNYSAFHTIPGNAIMGTAVTALAAAATETWDRVGTVRVSLADAGFGLETVTDMQVLGGANAALLGDEIVQFTTAVQVDASTWDLSGLLRGRRGTESAVGGHAAGERFVLLTGGAIERKSVDLSEVGQQRHYKFVPFGAELADVTAETATYRAAALRPFSPVHIRGIRNGAGDLTISWVRRTRIGGAWQDGQDVPLAEQSESYEVDIMDGSDVVRTLTAAGPEAVYSAADQTADFGSTQAAVSVRVYQLSDAVGRGNKGDATI